MFGNWSVSGLITMAMLVPLQPATASDRFNNYLKITVLNSNRAMKPIDDGRFLRTLADYERRLKLPEGDACDPRGVRPIRGAKPIYLRNGGPGGLTKCKRGIQRRHPSPTNFNFRTRWNPATHAYEDDYMHKDRRTVRLGILRDKTKKRWTRKRYHCIWTINGVTDNRRQPCRTYKRELGFGTHSAKAVIWRGKRKITTTGTYSFTLSDFKLVAVGDSFGSGEGNPHRYPSAFSGGLYYVKPALWLDPRCHRSLFSSSGIASALIANLNGSARNLGDRTSNLYSVSSMNFACSGASTDFGLNKKYGGKLSAYQVSKLWTDLGEKPNLPTEMFFRGTPPPARRLRAGTSRNPTPPDLPSQFQQIKDHLCKKNGQNELTCRRPDALLFYMGINDVGFADQLIQLIKRCDRKPNCLAGREKLVTKGLEKVTANLREFDRRLKKSKLSSESSKNIYIVEYPNPLSRNKRNDFCNDLKKLREKNNKPLVPYARFLGYGISKGAAEWAKVNILDKTNETLEEVANKLGWTVLKTQETINGHGYCSTRRFFNTFDDSAAKQGLDPKDTILDTSKPIKASIGVGGFPSGTLHPNYFGHRQIAAIIYNTFTDDFGLRPAKN